MFLISTEKFSRQVKVKKIIPLSQFVSTCECTCIFYGLGRSFLTEENICDNLQTSNKVRIILGLFLKGKLQ